MTKSILVLCPIYAPYGGGGGQYFPLLVEGLIKTNYFNRVVVITEYHKNHELKEVEGAVTVLRIIPRRDSLENKSFFYSVFSFISAYIIITLLIPVIAVYYQINIIQFTRYYYFPIFIMCSLMKKFRNIQTIMDIRTNAERDSIFSNSFGVDIYLSMSKKITKQLHSAGVDAKKIVEIPNVIKFTTNGNAEKQNAIVDKVLNDNKEFMLFVGQLIERKSIFEVLNAFRLYRKIDPSVYLVLIGRDMYDLKSRGYLRASDGIIFLGEQNRDVVLEFVRRSSMILQPSKLEGVSRVALEALYFRKKVLLPNCVDEFVESNPDFVVRQNTVDEIFLKMKEIRSSNNVPVYDLDIHSPKMHLEKIKKLYWEVLFD